MPARSRKAIKLNCPGCGQSGLANIGYGSERVSASVVAGRFSVIISDPQDAPVIVCAECQSAVRSLDGDPRE